MRVFSKNNLTLIILLSVVLLLGMVLFNANFSEGLTFDNTAKVSSSNTKVLNDLQVIQNQSPDQTIKNEIQTIINNSKQ